MTTSIRPSLGVAGRSAHGSGRAWWPRGRHAFDHGISATGTIRVPGARGGGGYHRYSPRVVAVLLLGAVGLAAAGCAGSVADRPRPSVSPTPRAQSQLISLWDNDAKPVPEADPDPAAVEVGLRFRVDIPGEILGIRFYKGPDNIGDHTVSLWSGAGERLATATATGESNTGWQVVMLARPVSVQVATTYTASYFAPTGHYSATPEFFDQVVPVSGPLRVAGATSGVYHYGGGFPETTYRDSNYWTDVLFRPASQSSGEPAAAPVTPVS
ncbi:DUF4082 domain-containing protein [Frankia sp. Cas4]|uniref:DUF4082 domain-containing protein n=1 Tax=Frankia sp. Cas4 TaxID=3073927 RepID=UPI002AD366C7|nr:DUF4082 domain-containing protein [Frankia sp. Cas4]